MGVKVKTKINKFPHMEKSLQSLNGKKVVVGVLGGGEQSWLAGIHEYGCNITPARAQFLTVPCNRKAFGKKASDFSDLFFIETDKGEKFLVRNKGKNQLEFMFWLTRSVHIPERSFLRSGHDTHIDKVLNKASRFEALLLKGTITADRYCNALGILLKDAIKDYARSLDSPAKQKVTIEAEGGNKTNPLINTGDMINAISYRVEG